MFCSKFPLAAQEDYQQERQDKYHHRSRPIELPIRHFCVQLPCPSRGSLEGSLSVVHAGAQAAQEVVVLAELGVEGVGLVADLLEGGVEVVQVEVLLS